MKKICTLVVMLAFAIISQSQTNTFPSSGNVGINNTNPQFPLDVHGNMRVTDTIFTSGVVISNQMNVGTATLGTVNTNTSSVTGTSTIGGNLGLGTLTPSVKLDVVGNAKIIGKLTVDTISTRNFLDSIKIGHSIVIDGIKNRIYAECDGPCSYPGLGIGRYTQGFGDNSVAIGLGLDELHPLYNYIPNSLMVGFNSNIPTLFVGSSTGLGTVAYVGIGTASPNCELHIKSRLGNADLCLESELGQKWDIAVDDNSNFGIYQPSTGLTRLNINNNGQVKIGKLVPIGTHSDYQLSIDGKVLAKSFYVTQLNWADHVFNKDYKLMPWNEQESYFMQNGHLEGVPKTEEVLANGNNVAETDAIFLRKLEEAYLYIGEVKKENEALRNEINEIKMLLKNKK